LQIKRVDKFTAIFSGNRCFFDNPRDAHFIITYSPNPNCHDYDFLRKKKIKGKEIFGVIDYFFTKSTEKLKALVSARVNGGTEISYIIEPNPHFFKLASNYKEYLPQLPAEWKFPKVQLLGLKIFNSEKSLRITSEFSGENLCPRVCSDGFCSGKCDFRVPVFGLAKLYKFQSGSLRLLDEWYQGFTIPPNWQGINSRVQGMAKYIDELKIGKKYKIKFFMGEPKMDYYFAFKRLKSQFKIPRLINRNTPVNGIFRPLPILRPMDNFSRISRIPSLIETKKFSGINRLLSLNMVSAKHWPPLYESICGTECIEKNFDNHTEFTATFEVQDIKGEEYIIKNLRIEGNSKISNKINKINDEKKPTLDCSR